jgi:hypothetical protein
MLGKIISPEQSNKGKLLVLANDYQDARQNYLSRAIKTKANDFFNLQLKMWTNYRVVAADNLLIGRTNRVSKRLASLALGS